MIGFCQRRFPDETWLLGDMRELKLEQRFDVIFAWDSFFHLDRESQRLVGREQQHDDQERYERRLAPDPPVPP